MGKNLDLLDRPDHIQNHPVVHVSGTTICKTAKEYISVTSDKNPLTTLHSNEHVVEKILTWRKRGRELEVLTLRKEEWLLDAIWQPKIDFAYQNDTVKEILQKYLKEKNALP